jgi:hypothetical protein
MSNWKIELRELGKIVRFFAEVLGLLALGWLVIVSLSVVIGI